MSRSVICQRCKQLVAIEERRWMPHLNAAGEQCPISNTIFTAPAIHRMEGDGRPRIEFVGARTAECPGCHAPNAGIELIFRRFGQNPASN